ncbi:hypothetical protein DUNSADRAFT_12729, partial [Dunaliella salina]
PPPPPSPVPPSPPSPSSPPLPPVEEPYCSRSKYYGYPSSPTSNTAFPLGIQRTQSGSPDGSWAIGPATVGIAILDTGEGPVLILHF